MEGLERERHRGRGVEYYREIWRRICREFHGERQGEVISNPLRGDGKAEVELVETASSRWRRRRGSDGALTRGTKIVMHVKSADKHLVSGGGGDGVEEV